jgi:zinc transport system substrate-binding protein
MNSKIRTPAALPLLPALLLPALLASCGAEPENTPQAGDSKLVYASFEPQRWLSAQLVGELAEIAVITAEGEDPLHYTPDEKQLAAIQQAKLVVLNGAGAEPWTDKLSLPLSKTVNTSDAFHDEYIEIQGAIKHSHGPGKEHTHAGTDPHIWLDPENLRRMARAIHASLIKIWPEQKDALGKRLQATEKAIDALHQGFESLGKQPEGEVFVASHPAYNYVARRYGWEMLNLDLDPETMPGDEVFAELKEKLQSHKARYIFWEGEPKAEIAARFKTELGLESVLFSPGELLSKDELAKGEDFASVMQANMQRLQPVFAGQ